MQKSRLQLSIAAIASISQSASSRTAYGRCVIAPVDGAAGLQRLFNAANATDRSTLLFPAECNPDQLSNLAPSSASDINPCNPGILAAIVTLNADCCSDSDVETMTTSIEQANETVLLLAF